MTSSEDIELLFKLLKKRSFHLIFAQFFHYTSIRELLDRITQMHPALHVEGIDLDKADVPLLRDFLKQAEAIDVVLFHNFGALLREDKQELRIYLNQRRDALAAHTTTYIAFVDGAENMKKASQMMPDLWSFRSLVMELPLPAMGADSRMNLTRPMSEDHQASMAVSEAEMERLEKRLHELLGVPEGQDLAQDYLKQLLGTYRNMPDPRQQIRKLERLQRIIDDSQANESAWHRWDLLNAFGQAYNQQGEYDKAIMRFEQAIDIGVKELGEDHPNIASSLNNLGFAWESKGEHDKAIAYFEQALAIDRKVFGEEHPKVATGLNNLGSVWDSKGEYDKAIDHLEQAFDIDRKVFGEEHFLTAIRLSNLGSAWASKGEYDKAIAYFEKALAIDRKVFGEENSSVATRLNNLGWSWDSKGEYEKAIGYYEQALAINRKVFGEKHPSLATPLNNLGAAYIKKKEYNKAIVYFEQALDIFVKFLGEEHPHSMAASGWLAIARAALASQTPPPSP